MATAFTDYPAHTMGSNDFTLYPYQGAAWNDDSFLPNAGFPESNFINPTTLDSFPANAAYATDHFTLHPEAYQQQPQSHPRDTLQAASSTYSPAPSVSHSFDPQNPPFLSSTSDSGASVQSTLSSAMGSPSAHAQAGAVADWSLQDMSVVPGIVQHDSLTTANPELFAATAFDIESIPVTDKGCVGEFSAISSSHQPPLSPVAAFHDASAIGFEGLGDHSSWSFTSAHDPFALPAHERHAWSGVATPALSGAKLGSTSPHDSLFKSPTTPASATSPVLERVRGKRASSVAPPTPKRVHGSSPLATAVSYSESSLPVRPQAPPPSFSSPFFQSSGHFVLPLESSCPSPLLSSPRLLFLL